MAPGLLRFARNDGALLFPGSDRGDRLGHRFVHPLAQSMIGEVDVGVGEIGLERRRDVGVVLADLRGDKPYLVGGSTLTQQIVKNTFLTPEKTLRRKVQEQFMALVLESRFTKNQILELYLNLVEWGPGVYGAEAASRFYYHTSARNIGRQEAAQLAAVLPAPLKRRPERMTRYPAIILNRMHQMGW